jgi:hypothetical protein
LNNTSAFALTVIVVLSTPSYTTSDPTVTFDGHLIKVFSLPVLGEASFPVNVSLDDLLTGATKRWEVRKVTVTSTKASGSGSLVVTLAIPIYPVVRGCEGIGSADLCAAAPMCIYCTSVTPYRLLLAEEGDDYDMRAETESEAAAETASIWHWGRGEREAAHDGVSKYGAQSDLLLAEDHLSSYQGQEQGQGQGQQRKRELYTSIVPTQLNAQVKYTGLIGGVCATGSHASVSQSKL